MSPKIACLICGQPATVRAQVFDQKTGGTTLVLTCEHCGWREYKDVSPELAETNSRAAR
jgi:hypothetical protein